MRRMVSQPSMPGIARSISIASGCQLARAGRAHRGRRRPCAARSRAARARCTSSSRSTSSLSTTSTRRRAPVVADARARAAAAPLGRRGAHLGQEQADAEQRCPAPGVLCTVISPPIRSVSILLIVRPRPVPPARRGSPRSRRARRARRSCSSSSGAMPGPVSSISNSRHLARIAQAERDLPAARELDRVAQHVDQDLAHALLVGAHHLGQCAGDLVAEREALAGRLQLEHARDLLHAAPRSASACTSSVSLPPSMRAMSSVPSISDSRCSPPRWITLTACLRCGGTRRVLAEQLRVAEDAVERRAQLVADGADVAALGLVGVVRALRLACCSCFVGARCDSISRCNAAISLISSVGLAVALLLRHLAALVRQHQPPGDDAGDQQQRGSTPSGSPSAAQRRRAARRRAARRAAQLLRGRAGRTAPASSGTTISISSR